MRKFLAPMAAALGALGVVGGGAAPTPPGSDTLVPSPRADLGVVVPRKGLETGSPRRHKSKIGRVAGGVIPAGGVRRGAGGVRRRTVAGMCGRYATTRNDPDLSDLFDAVTITPGPPPSWNVAPTDPVPLIRISRSREARVLDTARWGLVPPWAADMRGGARMINARAETVATSPAFAPSFARRRCLIPADGWYEWVRDGRSRRPYYMTPVGSVPLAFAGLWSPWGPEGVLTCTIVTTAALGGLTAVHDRMPLVLSPERWPSWLAGEGDPVGLLSPPTPEEIAAIEIRPVRPDVGNVRNNGPELTMPPPPRPVDATLF